MAKWIRAVTVGVLSSLASGACRDAPSTTRARPEPASASASTSASADIPAPSSYLLPSSVPPREMARAIVLRVTAAGVFAGEEKIESGDHTRLERLDGVVAFLRARRDERKEADPTAPFEGVLILDVDEDTPAILVKSTFQSAAFAGFRSVGFAPRRND